MTLPEVVCVLAAAAAATAVVARLRATDLE